MEEQGRKRQITCLGIGLLCAVLVYLALTYHTQATVSHITLMGRFPPGCSLQVQVTSKMGVSKLDVITVNKNATGEPQRIGTQKLNIAAAEIVLEFDVPEETASPIYIDLHNIQIFLPFAGNKYISQQSIRKLFDSDQFAKGSLAVLQVDQTSRSARLELKKPFGLKPDMAYLALAALIGLAIYLLAINSVWTKLPAFSDMELGNKISSTHEFDSVNGLRGLAALLVLFSHAAPGFYDIQLGLTLLFIFSGFLLSKPFVMDADKIYSWPNIQTYLTKRLKRILPVYYLYIFITYVVSFELDTALRHFLFVEAGGHLWPMTQIFTFYMLLPLVLLITASSYRLHRLLPLILLATAAYCWLSYATDWKPYYNGHYRKEFYLQAFLLGVFGSYLQYDILNNWHAFKEFFVKYRSWLAIIAAIFALVTIAWSAPIMAPPKIHYYVSQFFVKCLLSLLIVLLALNIRGSWFNSIVSNWLLRSIGVVGFSFYILHGLGMQIVLKFQTQFLGIAQPLDRSWGFVLAAFLVTYVMALFSYSYVERPFFGYREQPTSGQT